MKAGNNENLKWEEFYNNYYTFCEMFPLRRIPEGTLIVTGDGEEHEVGSENPSIDSGLRVLKYTRVKKG
jgi:hypothetical protein